MDRHLVLRMRAAHHRSMLRIHLQFLRMVQTNRPGGAPKPNQVASEQARSAHLLLLGECSTAVRGQGMRPGGRPNLVIEVSVGRMRFLDVPVLCH